MPATFAVSLGNGCIDTYLPPLQRSFIGGNAVNVAVALQQAGYPTAFCGMVGSDTEGELILQALKDRGADTSQVQVYPGPTHRTIVRLKSAEEHQFVHELMDERPLFNPTEEMLAFVSRQRLAHCIWFDHPTKYLEVLSRVPGLILSLDYGEDSPAELVEETLALVSVAFFTLPAQRCNEAQDFARQMASRGPRQVIVLLGIEGSLVYDGQDVYRQPALPLEPVDTLGAGDAYIGTYLASTLLDIPIAESMRRATQAAAQTCSHLGAWPGAEIAHPRKFS